MEIALSSPDHTSGSHPVRCELCGSRPSEPTAVCDHCGYGFRTQEIEDRGKAKIWVYDRSQGWPEEVTLLKKVHDIQVKKHGMKHDHPGSSAAPGWSVPMTADLLGRKRQGVLEDIKLAEGLETYPELREYKNKTEAKDNLKKIKKALAGSAGSGGFTSESELQQYLQAHWEDTELGKEWNLFHRGKFNTGEVGEIDLLARHKRDAKWLVIELKVGRSSDEAVGQVLRYMGWVKLRLAEESENVEGCIICESADDTIRCALVRVPDISLYRYSFKEQRLELVEKSIARSRNLYNALAAVEQLTPEKLPEFISRISDRLDLLKVEEEPK